MADPVSAVIGVGGAILNYNSARQNQAAANAALANQFEIADRIQKREEELFKLWRDEYKECELALKNEVCNMPLYVPKTELAARRALTTVRREFNNAACKIKNCLPMECIGAFCAVERDIAFAEANAAVGAMNAAVYLEEQQKIVRDQQRRDEQYRMISLSHGAYFSSAGSVLAAEIYGQYARTAAQAAQRAGQGIGASLARAQRGFGTNLLGTTAPAPSTTNNIYVDPGNFGSGTSSFGVSDVGLIRAGDNFSAPNSGFGNIGGGDAIFT